MNVVTGRLPKKHVRRSVLGVLILFSLVGLSTAGGCGGGAPSGADDIFSDECRISDPDFPFCGLNIVRCRNHDETLYQVFDEVCPPGWTVVPDDVPFPELACTNPEGQTYNVDAEKCPPGWERFTIDLSLSVSSSQ